MDDPFEVALYKFKRGCAQHTSKLDSEKEEKK